ncbi:MAG: Hsp33 family molecular chaperone HslO [Atopobiaceae bacterium]|nr:Hsp33 family molecular chaperone HslO [Atopobiaceae bacterium]
MNTDVIDFDDARVRLNDHIVRGTAADGMVRAFAITARNTVQVAHENHGTSPLVSAALGRLMMAGQMMGLMYKSDDELVTLSVRGDGPIGGLTVTANNKGQVKGFANHPHVWLPLRPNEHLDVGSGVGKGSLSVVIDRPGTVPYSSQVELVSGEIGEDLTYYFAVSDQIPTSVGVGVLVDTDTSIRQAGGFIVQLMPGHLDEVVDQLEANLSGLTSVTDLLEAGMAPTDMLEHILAGMDYQELEVVPAEFYCGCDDVRAGRAVAALGRETLLDMIEHEESAEVYCHFCGKRHYLEPDALRDLLD